MIKTDENTTLADLKKKTLDFTKERDWEQFHTPKDMALNTVIEIGELLDHFRFRTSAEIVEILRDPKKKSDIAGEYSDAFYSMLRLADLLEIDMTQELTAKMNETARKYPISKAKGVNKKYNEL